MSRTKAKARRNGIPYSERRAAAQLAANKSNLERKRVLGRSSRPRRWPSRGQRKCLNAPLTRVGNRDKKLKESNLNTAPEDALNHKFENLRLAGQVESVLDVCTIDERTHYLVLWKEHHITESTWEAEENLANAVEAIEKFYAAFPNKKSGGPGEIEMKRET